MQEPGWDQPSPYTPGPVKGFHPWRWIAFAVFGVVVTFAAFFVPIPILYEYLPGPAPKVDRLITIEGARTYSSEGAFRLTTVSVDTQVTLAEWIASGFDPNTAVVTKDQVTGGQSLERLQDEQEEQMRESNQHSQEVALTSLGIAKPEGEGARVLGTLEETPARKFLKEDDVIVAVDGESVSTICDVGRRIDSHEVGDEVEVTVRRDGERRTFTLRTIANPQDPASPFIGVAMEEVNYSFEPGVDVTFDPGDIAGPSAGLMFALQIYDRLTPEDLTHGRQIAGTGEIGCDGSVTPIGGVEQKVAAAEREGADIFLAPTLNADAAEQAAGDIEVVAISTFDDAISYLEDLE